jgi:tRNA threonylcarbamoyladenosine modification (KEOPS) complex  Pcc1 subunit
MRSASFIFNFDSKKEAEIIAETLKPEIKHKIPKTDVEISLSENKICLKINAKDISSLRAAINSYLRWINTALNVKKTV